ncbi:DUF4214 domain-containing protein [Pigmentiphaga aceris]|uniref:DUF4214 domain-containing protein n=1 Tax=Pigmentiphaga aceris TaxID=1940612 RepID=A0A5C0AYS1_9BURK|nr:DUF4214 domain-containing protein [Pigmentiphaga aceris]QEI06553.1 DUF4214 domain-containing protein [Pigmentiphaga aceris]
MNDYTADIQKLYIAYFGRPADPNGLAFWEAQAARDGNVAAVAKAFTTSPEYQALYAGRTNAQIVDAIYVNLLARHAEPAGLQYWVGRLDSNALEVSSLVIAIMSAAQNSETIADRLAMSNKVAAALQFTASVDTAAEINAYSTNAGAAIAKTWLAGVTDSASSLAAATASQDSTISRVVASTLPPEEVPPAPRPITFTLTTGADTFTGDSENDRFVVAAGTLNAGDALNGGGGYDVLSVTASGQTLAGTLTSIEEIRLVDGGTFSAAASALGKMAFGHMDTKDTADVTLIIDVASSATFDLSGVTAGQEGAAGSRIRAVYTNVATSALNVTLSGLGDTFTGSANADIIHGGAGDDVITGGDGNDTIEGGTGADNLNGGDGDDVFVGFDGQDFVNGGTGTNTLRLTATSADLNTANDAQLVLVQQVDASTAAVGVTVNLSSQSEGISVFGSAQADVLQGGAGNDQLSGGAGDDTFVGFEGADTIDGGTGTNTLRLTATSASLNASVNGALVNLQRVDASTAAAGVTVNLSAHSPGFTVTGSAHDDFLSGSAGNDVLMGGDGNDLLVGGPGADTLIGGDGADTYAYDANTEGGDIIENFGAGDKVALRGGQFSGINQADHIKAISGANAYNGGFGYSFDGGAYALIYTDTATGKTSLIIDDNGNDTSGGYTVLVSEFKTAIVGPVPGDIQIVP